MKPAVLIPAIAAAVMLSIVLPAPAAGQGASETSGVNAPAVVTSGEGIVRRAPDRAFFDVTVETRARNPRDAQVQNAEAMSNVQQRLRAANVPKDAIRTLSYSVNPEYDFSNGRRTLRGYVAVNSIELRVDDLGRLGELVDLATNAGATSVGDVRFDLKEREAAERQALAEAVADAKARAEAIAAAAGRTIQTIWRIIESGVEPPQPPRPMMLGRAAAAEAAPTPIIAGQIEIRAHVTLTALIK